MKPTVSRKKQPSIGIALFGLLMCCLMAITTPGCATRSQVEEIVARSNAVLLNNSLTDPLEINETLIPSKRPAGGSTGP